MTNGGAAPFPENVQVTPPTPPGQLDTPVQDRSIPHYFISEVELAMLETGSGNTDRTVAGLAFGASVAFGVADRTVKDLGPYNHALFVVGFWALLLVAGYSALRAWRARSLNVKTAAAVKQRSTTDTRVSETSQPSVRQRIGRRVAGD